MASQGVASMFALALLLGAFASIPQSDYLSLSFLFFFSLYLSLVFFFRFVACLENH